MSAPCPPNRSGPRSTRRFRSKASDNRQFGIDLAAGSSNRPEKLTVGPFATADTPGSSPDCSDNIPALCRLDSIYSGRQVLHLLSVPFLALSAIHLSNARRSAEHTFL